MIPYVTLENCLRTAVGTGANPGMRWLTHWISTGTRANTVAAAENQLATSPNAADLSTAVNGYFEIPNVNFRDTETDVVAGLFGDNRPAPRDDFETVFPGMPSTAPADPNYIAGVALAFIEFPAPGMYYMGVNRDDGFRLTVATTEGGRDFVTGPNVQEVGVFNGGGGTDANNVQPNGFMPVYVPQAGVWPFRLLYWAGTGDDNVEWFQTNEQMPIGLINDSQTTEHAACVPDADRATAGGLRTRRAPTLPPSRTAERTSARFFRHIAGSNHDQRTVQRSERNLTAHRPDDGNDAVLSR